MICTRHLTSIGGAKTKSSGWCSCSGSGCPKSWGCESCRAKIQLMLKTHSNRCRVGGFVLFFSPPPNSTEIGESLNKRVPRLLVWSNFVRLDTQLFEKSEYNYIILNKESKTNK